MTYTDWPATVAHFREMFGEHFAPYSKHPRLRGANFVTPEYLGCVTSASGDVAEVSTGIMPNFGERPRSESRVYGVTFARLAGGTPDDRDQMCETLAEVARTLGLAPALAAGDRVKIISDDEDGYWRGQTGRVISADDDDVTLWVDAYGKDATFNPSDVEKLSAS